jgi:hypothetical protein
MNIVKKATAVALVAAAALAVSACGKTETTNISENTTMTDMNATMPEGSMNDMSMGDTNSSNDMGGDMMGSNSSNMM